MTAVVLFDFGGTLDADGVTWKERFYRLYRAEGAIVPPERFDPVYYKADDALVGTIPATLSFRDTVFRLAAGVTSGLGLHDEGLTARVAARFLEDALERLRTNLPLLARLAGPYRLGIVSNFYGNLATVCDNAKVAQFFSVIVDSAQVGLLKPNPRIFLRAVEDLGVAPGQAIFVGDSFPRDMVGARAAGMPHIWLVEDPAGRGAPCCPGDRTVRSLRDLEALLL